MKISVLGTGSVGQAHTKKLAELGHDVVIGTRDPTSQKLKGVKFASFAEAALHGQIIIEALKGNVALQALKAIKHELEGKILIDVSNPLDFSTGELRLTVSNTDSMGEQIQKALPNTKVVKAFNTANATVQVNPGSVVKADHHLFIAGNDAGAKKQVTKLAKSYGWKNIIDLGDIKSARGMEMILPIWVNLMRVQGTSAFNFKIAK